jgi:hypothetical protein
MQIEGIIKQLSTAGEHEKIAAVIGLLTSDFAMSPQANHRKVGLNRFYSCSSSCCCCCWRCRCGGSDLLISMPFCG